MMTPMAIPKKPPTTLKAMIELRSVAVLSLPITQPTTQIKPINISTLSEFNNN